MRFLSRFSCSAIVLLFLLISVQGCLSRALVSENELLLGEHSLCREEFLEIPIQPMVELDGQTKEEILSLRKAAVEKYSLRLLKNSYKPSEVIFGEIVSGKPWWGIAGCSIYGSGDKSILGASEESRYLLNPYLLVGVSSWSNEIWDKEKLSQTEWSKPDFPFCWSPSSLKIFPSKSSLETIYEVTAFNKALADLEPYILDRSPVNKFDLVAYNARDFGFNFLHVPEENCINIENAAKTKKPVQILQFIHCGGSSGYPGGSNNMSPLQKEIHEFTVTELPAMMEVRLWRKEPGTIESAPDLKVYIEFR